LHSLWTPEPADTSFKVGVLAGLSSQDELDELVRARGQAAKYTTLHPRGGGPGPQEMAELNRIRSQLEDSKNTWKSSVSCWPAPCLPGARRERKKILPLKYPNLRTEPGRSGWKGLDELL
jgi:hypothetical protein